jgi:hypothetical protein
MAFVAELDIWTTHYVCQQCGKAGFVQWTERCPDWAASDRRAEPSPEIRLKGMQPYCVTCDVRVHHNPNSRILRLSDGSVGL